MRIRPVIIRLSVLLATVSAFGQPFPPYRDVAVNDYAHLISTSYERRMEALAREMLQKTGAALVVATVEEMGGMEIDDYASRLFESWGIGKRGEEGGVLFLLAARERKVRIEVGYGLEGILPDGLTGSILDQYAVPDFREGDYGRGFYRSMLVVSGLIAEEAGVSITGGDPADSRDRPAQEREEERGGGLFIVLFIFLMIVTRGRILPWLFLSMLAGGGRGGGFGGGGFSGGFGGFGGGMSGGGGASRSF